MEFVPIRCLIPDHLRRIGKNQQWLADQAYLSKSQISDYVHMRYIPSLPIAKKIAFLLNLRRLDDLYLWDRREE